MCNAYTANQAQHLQQLAMQNALGQIHFNDMPNYGPTKTRCSYCRTLGTEDKCINCGAPR